MVCVLGIPHCFVESSFIPSHEFALARGVRMLRAVAPTIFGLFVRLFLRWVFIARLRSIFLLPFTFALALASFVAFLGAGLRSLEGFVFSFEGQVRLRRQDIRSGLCRGFGITLEVGQVVIDVGNNILECVHRFVFVFETELPKYAVNKDMASD